MEKDFLNKKAAEDAKMTKLQAAVNETCALAQKKGEELTELDRIAKMLVKRDLALTEMREKREQEFQELERKTKELTESKQALLNILEDVDEERKKAEEERDKTLAIIKNFADGLLLIESGIIILLNPKAEEFFEISEKEVVNKQLLALDKKKPLFKPFFDLIKTKCTEKVFREEITIRDNLVLEVSIVCIGQENRCAAQMIILHDVTREKSVERLKTEFVSIAAHQLRTPLSAIKWILSMLLDGDVGEVPPEQKDLLEKTYQSNERMIRLVNDLLNTTRIEEGKFLAKIVQQDIRDLVEKTVAPFREEVKRKGLTLECQLPAGRLPKVGVDAEKLCLAIQNLMDNALHYTKVGGIKITLNFKKDENTFLFSIADTGMGIPKEEQPRVFSKFFRSATAIRAETEGSGLGLFIAKNVVEAHGGKIWFENQEGQGATFYFTLPIPARPSAGLKPVIKD